MLAVIYPNPGAAILYASGLAILPGGVVVIHPNAVPEILLSGVDLAAARYR